MGLPIETLIAPVAAAMRHAAETAILPRYRRLTAHEVEEKSAGEVVTQADRDAEAILTPVLRSLVEGSRVVGEEAAASQPELLQGLDSGIVWLVDPLDGTSNFVSGNGPFAVMVALLERGQTRASWILDPLSGTEYFAGPDMGARMNGQRLAPSHIDGANRPASELRGAILTRFLPLDVRPRVEQGRKRIGATTNGTLCAGAEYPAIALGRQDFTLFWRTLPWDHAPGALLVTETGGHVARPDGSPYVPGDGKSGLLAARSAACWHEVHRAILA
jgi:fructose-1,6-bisphosphatase/inositol monophosphatase family enzyme